MTDFDKDSYSKYFSKITSSEGVTKEDLQNYLACLKKYMETQFDVMDNDYFQFKGYELKNKN